MSGKPIASYAMIGNCRSAALVGRDGSIDWWCAPRFDSPAIFASVLDAGAGHFRISPSGSYAVTRRYLERSMVLETTMASDSGVLVVTDALAFGVDEKGHEIGRAAPALILRSVRCVAGSVDVELEFAPRPEFGLVTPLVEMSGRGAVARGGPDVLVLSAASLPLEISKGTVHSRFTLAAGEQRCVCVERVASPSPSPKIRREREIADRIVAARKGWQSWSEMHLSYRGDYHELVHHSGRVLQALTYQPTGAIVAAPTTSLPEEPGGSNNWDYRYAWVRDASLTMNALWLAACPDEAERFFDWLASTAAGNIREGDLQVVFGVGGEYDLSERELPHLRGWRDSKPVRVGNAAWRQRQLDVYGEVAGAAFRFRDQFESFAPASKRFVIDAIERAAELWSQPDHGLWEAREGKEHYVHSKLMCWQALEAGIALADQLDVRDRVERWASRRDEIDAAIRSRGWNEEKQTYVQAFGSATIDAAALLMPISGFLAVDDARARSTVETVSRELATGKLLRRYDGDGRSAFVICSFWLAHARAVLGDVDEAREIFDATAATANDVGLFSEEFDVESGEQLGNMPQAFSHVGLINAAGAIDLATRRRAG